MKFNHPMLDIVIVVAVLIILILTVSIVTAPVIADEEIPETTCVSAGLAFSPKKVFIESGETTEPVIETEPVETEPIPTEPPEPERAYYDVPLDRDLQDHIFEVCEDYGIDPAIIVAMIRMESTYNPNCIGDNGNSFGLMQIQPRWHSERMEKLGCTDLLDPYQNVVVGIDYLAELYRHYGSMTYALIAYNGGYSRANDLRAAGESNGYANTVLYWAGQF